MKDSQRAHPIRSLSEPAALATPPARLSRFPAARQHTPKNRASTGLRGILITALLLGFALLCFLLEQIASSQGSWFGGTFWFFLGL